MDTRQELLKELEALGINPVTGRKIRTDKGQSHNMTKTRSDKGKTHTITKTRSDKGKYHDVKKTRSDKGEHRSPLIAYKLLKYKLLSMPLPNEDTPHYLRDYHVQYDYNGIFYVLEKYSHELIKPGGGRYIDERSGTKTYRNTRWRSGKLTDLEEYRFNALQSVMSHRPIDVDPTSQDEIFLLFKKEFRVLNVDNTFDLFCALYHIAQKDAYDWDYTHWRHDYECVGGDVLSDDFTFNLTYPPGSPEFHPEYATVAYSEYEASATLADTNKDNKGDS